MRLSDEVALGDTAAVFLPGDPPRTGRIALWSSSLAGLPEQPGTVQQHPVAVPVAGTIEVRTLAMPTMEVAAAIPWLLQARFDPQAHPAVRFWCAATVAGLELIRAGQLLPGVSPEGHDAWRVGPFEADDMVRLHALADAMPAQARAVPCAGTGADADDAVLPTSWGLLRAYLDAIADAMPRTPAAAWVTGSPAYSAHAGGEAATSLTDWAREVGLGVDIGVGLTLHLVVHSQDGDGPHLSAQVHARRLADPTVVSDVARLWAGHAPDMGEQARLDTVVAIRAAARAWPPLGYLLDQEVPDQLDITDEDVEDLLSGAEQRLREAGVHIVWPPDLARDLSTRAVIVSDEPAPEDVGAWLVANEMLPMKWQLTVDGIALDDTETRATAEAKRPVVRLRGHWVLIEPRTRARARRPQLPAMPGAQAFRLMLAGDTELDDERVEVAVEGWLDTLRRLIMTPDGGDEPLRSPEGLTASLRGYQQRGLRWLERMTDHGLGCCLADDMGLGKTITVIALQLRRHAAENGGARTLVVCPASLIGNWEREFQRFAPEVVTHRFHGPGRTLEGIESGVVLTTYATLRADAEQLSTRTWTMVVADEAQHVKNPRSATARALRRLPAQARVALTGTPVQNNLQDLWSILDWSTPGLLGTGQDFQEQWARPVESATTVAAAQRLHRLVSPFLLRRRKSDPQVAPELPAKTETDHLVALTQEQVDLYDDVSRTLLRQIRRKEPGIVRSGLVLKLITALKQICNHPAHYLRDQRADLAGGSGKLDLLDELLETILAEGQSVLIFTQYVQMARLLQRHLNERAISTLFLHGGLPLGRRDDIVRDFQAGTAPVFLLSLTAGGTGLNLTRAEHVVHYDRWWNPAVEDQATDRAHRIGQTRAVQVHRLVTEGTLEDRIAELLRYKNDLADVVLGRGEAALSELSDRQLTELVALRRDHE